MTEGFDFKNIFLCSTAPQAILDRDYRIVAANTAYCDKVRSTPDVLIGALLFDLYPEKPERVALFTKIFDAAIAGEPGALSEMHYPIRDPSAPEDPRDDLWWTLDCTPLPPHPKHGPVFMVHLRDATDHVRERRKSDLYAAELQHRIGNVLTLVQILARKTAQTSTDVESFLPAFDERIGALGKTHAFLSGVNWNGMTLRQILEQQLKIPDISRPDAITMRGPDWHLSVLHAQAFAMAIHELVMNSLKFGVLGADAGSLSIMWDHPADGSYSFIWKESGKTLAKPPKSSGFGMEMLTRLLPGQLGGKAVKSFTSDGFHYALVVPDAVPIPVGQKKR